MRGFFKRLLGGGDEADQLCDVATGDWAPVPVSAAGQQADWVDWLAEDEVEELLELEDYVDAEGNEDDGSAVQRLAARTLAAHRAAKTTAKHCEPQEPHPETAPLLTLSPLANAAPPAPARRPAPPQTGPQPRVAPRQTPPPRTPQTGPQPRLSPLESGAPAPQTGPQRELSPLALAPTREVPMPPAVDASSAAPADSSAPSHLDYLSPEERAIVEAQRSNATPAAPPAPPSNGTANKLRPAPQTTRPRFATSPVATCARNSGTTRPSRPRMRAITGRKLRPAPARNNPPASAADSGDWTAMVKAYGEHLTDEEILILRKQLG